jgi:TolA-binding protein
LLASLKRSMLIIWGISVSFLLRVSLQAQVPNVEQSIHPDKISKSESWTGTGGYHAARQELEQVYPLLSITENHRDVLFVLIECAFEDQEYDNAFQWSYDFLTEYPNDGRLNTVRFIYGVSAFQTERSDIALQALDTFLSESISHPMHGAGYFWRAMSKLDKNNWQSAEEDVQNCYNDTSAIKYHDIALMGWALSLERRGEYMKAIDLLEKLLTDFPGSSLISDVKIRLASLSLRTGYPLRTIQTLEGIKPKGYQKQEYALLQAEANLQLKHYEDSQVEYKQFLKEYSGSRYIRNAQYGLAWTYLKNKNYSAARKEFDSLGVGTDSLAFASLYQSGVLALLQNKTFEALARFDTLTEHSPYDNVAENAYYQIGITQYRAKRYHEARRAFQLAARLFPESKNRARSYRMLGETSMALSDFSNAQYAFSRVRQLSVLSDLIAPSMFQEGVCLYHLGRFKSGADLFSNFVRQFPKDERAAEANLWMGEAFYQDGKYADAEHSYTEALRLFSNSPKRVEALYGIAWSLFEQKKFSQSAVSFDRFIAQYPNDERTLDATLRQADCYYFMGEYEKSSALYAAITDLKKNTQYAEYASFQIAMSYIQRGETERGIEQLRNFLVRFPNSLYDEVVQFNVGWIYFSTNQYNRRVWSSEGSLINILKAS